MSEQIAYYSAHRRVWRIRGKASFHSCIRCGSQASDWAYTHDDPCPQEWISPRGYRYSGDVRRYTPMCHPCHVEYDKPEITHCPQGHEYNDENTILDAGKRKCKTCVYKRNRDRGKQFGLSPEQRARKTLLQRERRAARRAAA